MQVICIDNSPGEHGFAQKMLEVGKEYSVSQNETRPNGYDVEGLLFNPSTGHRVCFTKHRFIPVSDIDETELARERKTQTA